MKTQLSDSTLRGTARSAPIAARALAFQSTTGRTSEIWDNLSRRIGAGVLGTAAGDGIAARAEEQTGLRVGSLA